MKTRTVIAIVLTFLLSVANVASINAQDGENSTEIVFGNNTAVVNGEGVLVDTNHIRIHAAGTYELSGILDDGQLVVDTADEGVVVLIFNGLSLHNSEDTALYIQNAQAVEINLLADTSNIITTDAPFSSDDEALNAAIFSQTNLIISGNGYLSVEAPAVDGIVSAASITINAAPTISVYAGDDAIQAETIFSISGGTLELVAGGGMENSLADELSGKGIKVEEQIVIDAATITIDAADDAIRSEGDLVINSGDITLNSLDKAIHGSYNLEINDGNINILASDEGIEGGFITINGGNIHIIASDDGINISEPDDIPAPLLYYLRINGGYIVVDAAGDGIDSNGSIDMTGGTVIVNGPTANDNAALDYDGIFTISGGTLIAAGSAGMAVAPGTDSTQNTLHINFDTAFEADTLVNVQSEDGLSILTFAPSKSFQSLVFSSPNLLSDTAYKVYVGGSAEGDTLDGIYLDATYTDGIEQASFTLIEVVTQIGQIGMRGGMPPRGEGRPDFGNAPNPPNAATPIPR